MDLIINSCLFCYLVGKSSRYWFFHKPNRSSLSESTHPRGRGRGRGGGAGVRGGRGRATAPSVLKNQTKLNFSEVQTKAAKSQLATFDISEGENDGFSPAENGAPPGGLIN